MTTSSHISSKGLSLEHRRNMQNVPPAARAGALPSETKHLVFPKPQHEQQPFQQVPTTKARQLINIEQIIVTEIDKCFQDWYEPWRQSYLDGGPKFSAIYDLMEGLLHYEEQITAPEGLPDERLRAVAKAVARLIDYGNAILDIDITIRSNDETFCELDSTTMTTIDLYKAHIKAHKLREKLLANYFKRAYSKQDHHCDADSPSSGANHNISSSPSSSSLRVPHSASTWSFPSPTMDRSQRFSIGSNTSINTISGSASDGRRTPQPLLSSSCIEVKTMSSTEDLTESQLEMKHMIATIRSRAFSEVKNSATRHTLLVGVLARIESLLTMPTNAEKLANCFDLLGALLDTIERLPSESRGEEVKMIANSCLKTLVRKVYIYDRDACVEFQNSHWTTYLLSLIRMMSAADFSAYLGNFSNLPDLSAFLKDYLFIIKRLISKARRPFDGDSPGSGGHSNQLLMLGVQMLAAANHHQDSNEPVYPDCWIEMSLLVCSTFLKSLMHLYQIMRQYFASNTPMWQSYIDCLIHFILQEVLRPDRPMLKQRQTLLANDMRKSSAEYVWIAWDSLSLEQKYQILEETIEPLLRACMVLNSHQRSILLPIFYDMMQCDYTSQYISPRGTICNSGSICGQSVLGQLDTQLYPDDEFDSQQLPSSTFRSTVTPNQSLRPNNSDESLPYLSFQDMARNLHASNSDDGTVLTKFTHLIVGKLNTLMIDNTNLGDQQFKDELCGAIAGKLDPKYNSQVHTNSPSALSTSSDLHQFKSMARHTSDLIAEFMQICLDLRQAHQLAYSHLRLLCLFKLILFFRDKVDRIELYLANLHKLWLLHHTNGRFIEAGFTLLEHAKSLPWTNKPLESHYRIITRSFQTHEPLADFKSLKLFLYTTIIEYFDQGQLWEAAVPLCRELIDIYQFKLYDYAKLAQVLSRLSNFFSNISGCQQLRSQPEYFRVSFYGVGFQSLVSLREATMIYRGKPYEKLADFQTTLLSKYPDAKLLKILGQPDEQLLMEPDAKYLQVNACSPVVDLNAKFNCVRGGGGTTTRSADQEDDPVKVGELHESIVSYYKHNDCDKFEFSRRISPPAQQPTPQTANQLDEFSNMWRQRIILTTNSLPGMLPFFPVFLTETNTISPIECAIEDLERANDRLFVMVNRFKADKRQEEDVRPLGQLLLGIVDAAVNGGITKYEQAFFNSNNNDNNANTSSNSDYYNRQPALALNDQSTANNLTVSTLDNKQARSNSKALLNQQAPPCHQHHIINGTRPTEQDQEQQQLPSAGQLEKLKCLIAKQMPLLDEAIRLHRERVAEVMRPQHEHLETSYKRLKGHVMSKYYRYLPADYNRSTNTISTRSFRSFARSPNRSIKGSSEAARISNCLLSTTLSNPGNSSGRLSLKRMSDVGGDTLPKWGQHQEVAAGQRELVTITGLDGLNGDDEVDGGDSNPKSNSNIPYKQLINERRSLPFLSGLQNLSLIERPQVPPSTTNLSPPDPPPVLPPIRPRVSFSKPESLVPPPPPVPLLAAQTHQANSANSTYVCLSDMMRVVNQRSSASNPYVRLKPDMEPNDDKFTRARMSENRLVDHQDSKEGDGHAKPNLVAL